MYRDGNDYDKMAQLAIDVYLDYDIHNFPIDENDLCKKLGVALVPYSELDSETREKAENYTKDAFYITPTLTSPPTIAYNDNTAISKGRLRFSIFHELKHFLNNDISENKYDEEMAEYFSKYLMCPIPYLICENIEDTATIISTFKVSSTVANNILCNIINRKNKYGNKIFDYEKPLIDFLCDDGLGGDVN